jgi:hypothetical protein
MGLSILNLDGLQTFIGQIQARAALRADEHQIVVAGRQRISTRRTAQHDQSHSSHFLAS